VTILELKNRLDATITFLDTLTETHFADVGERVVTLKYFAGKHFIGRDYLTEYAIPNFLFHVAAAYCILRAQGVPIGKTDYIGHLTLIED
jgi:hypothetical protein